MGKYREIKEEIVKKRQSIMMTRVANWSISPSPMYRPGERLTVQLVDPDFPVTYASSEHVFDEWFLSTRVIFIPAAPLLCSQVCSLVGPPTLARFLKPYFLEWLRGGLFSKYESKGSHSPEGYAGRGLPSYFNKPLSINHPTRGIHPQILRTWLELQSSPLYSSEFYSR